MGNFEHLGKQITAAVGSLVIVGLLFSNFLGQADPESLLEQNFGETSSVVASPRVTEFPNTSVTSPEPTQAEKPIPTPRPATKRPAKQRTESKTQPVTNASSQEQLTIAYDGSNDCGDASENLACVDQIPTTQQPQVSVGDEASKNDGQPTPISFEEIQIHRFVDPRGIAPPEFYRTESSSALGEDYDRTTNVDGLIQPKIEAAKPADPQIEPASDAPSLEGDQPRGVTVDDANSTNASSSLTLLEPATILKSTEHAANSAATADRADTIYPADMIGAASDISVINATA